MNYIIKESISKRLVSLLEIECVNPSKERVKDCQKLLKEMSPYKISYEGDMFLLFSNMELDKIPTDKEILLICNHFDTVHKDIPTRYDGEIVYGRGSVDDRANTAVMFDDNIYEEVEKCDKVVLYGITFDEETRVTGSKELVRFLKERNVKPDHVLLSEPTDFCASRRCHGNEIYNESYGWNGIYDDSIDDYDSIYDYNPCELYEHLIDLKTGNWIDITPPCEAGDYRQICKNTVICGPGHTNLCHRLDENITSDDLYKWSEIIRKLIRKNIYTSVEDVKRTIEELKESIERTEMDLKYNKNKLKRLEEQLKKDRKGNLILD